MRLPPLPVGDPAALVEAWLLRFPADFWYRQKYNLPLFSPTHKQTDLRSVRAEFEHENLLRRLRADARKKPTTPLTPDEQARQPLLRAARLEVVDMSAEDVEREFEALDLAQFDEPAR